MFFKKYVSLAVIAVLLVLVLAAFAPGLAGASTARAQATEPPVLPADAGITVMGVGTVSGTPDIANVTVGVESQGSDVKQVVADNNTKMNALIASLKAAGIADKDIQTMNYSIYAESPVGREISPDQPSQGLTVYHVTNQVQIVVREISNLSSVLDVAVENGANSIYGVSFSVSDPTKLEDQAREIAVTNAKARAEKLAKLQEVTLGSVISVEETGASPMPFYSVAKDMAQAGGAAIESGSIQVTVNLQVKYGIK